MSVTWLVLLAGLQLPAQAPELVLERVGNAGVVVSDGQTSLLVDLPHEPGAFGYLGYDPADLRPTGEVVSVITHHHRDHFAPELFVSRPNWKLMGPASVTGDVPADRVLSGDSVVVGDFTVVAVPTPHTDDHRSYRIGWRGRVLYVSGDTEDPAALLREDPLDVLFLTPWLSCVVAESGRSVSAARMVLYHGRPDGSDRVCGSAESLSPEDRLHLGPVDVATPDPGSAPPR